MKFSLAIFIALASVAYALPNTEVSQADAAALEAAAGCGAAGSCHGLGGSELCNDRCKRCSGPTGRYSRGGCCGFLNQACCCYYN